MANLIVLLAGPFPLVKLGSTMPLKIVVHLIHPLFEIVNKFQNNSKSVTVKQRVYFDRLQQQGDHGERDRTTGPFPLVKLGSTMPLKVDVHLIHPLFKHCKQMPN